MRPIRIEATTQARALPLRSPQGQATQSPVQSSASFLSRDPLYIRAGRGGSVITWRKIDARLVQRARALHCAVDIWAARSPVRRRRVLLGCGPALARRGRCASAWSSFRPGSPGTLFGGRRPILGPPRRRPELPTGRLCERRLRMHARPSIGAAKEDDTPRAHAGFARLAGAQTATRRQPPHRDGRHPPRGRCERGTRRAHVCACIGRTQTGALEPRCT